MAYEASEIMTAVALQSDMSTLDKVKNPMDLQKLINNGKKIVKAKKDIQFGDEKTFQGFSAKLTDKFIKDMAVGVSAAKGIRRYMNKASGKLTVYMTGNIFPKDVEASIPFFGDVKNYIGLLWSEYKKGFSLKSYIYNRDILHKNYSDMNPNKVFNYMIQLMETEYNIKMMGDLFKFLEDYDSKVVLYQYDSILIDFNLQDGKEFLVKVKNIVEQDGKFPVKVAYGKNYNEMKDFTEKLYAH